MYKIRAMVSVPYRGATFLNDNRHMTVGHDICFRPLSGSYISQLPDDLIITSLVAIVSVPYRGATFLNLLLQDLHHDPV